MNYINQHDFYLEVDGKTIDMDGVYGGQCWDLFSYYTQKYCGKVFSCSYTGYVIDLWNYFDELGLNAYFIKVDDDFKDGDWLIYKAPSEITKNSHIAMFRLDNGNNRSVILTQNPNGNIKYAHQMECSNEGIVGALRPIIYIENDSYKNNDQEINLNDLIKRIFGKLKRITYDIIKKYLKYVVLIIYKMIKKYIKKD